MILTTNNLFLLSTRPEEETHLGNSLCPLSGSVSADCGDLIYVRDTGH